MNETERQAGRVALGEVFGSGEYMTWASRVGNLIDARKLAAEFRGERKPSCGSLYGRGLQKLCRLFPPEVVVPSALSAVWRRDALYSVSLSSITGTIRAAARAHGFDTVYAHLLHTVYAEANERELLNVFRPEGWKVCGWGTYGQDTDPYQDGQSAARIVRRLELAGWKANGEAWAEGEFSWKTAAFLQGWKDAGGLGPLGWSVLSSDTDQFPRNFAYDVALSWPGADIDLQVYGASHPSYTVAAGLGMLARVPVPLDRTAITFEVTAAGMGPFEDYRTWMGPRRIWIGGNCIPATFDALAR